MKAKKDGKPAPPSPPPQHLPSLAAPMVAAPMPHHHQLHQVPDLAHYYNFC
jgi:hypothetical protein